MQMPTCNALVFNSATLECDLSYVFYASPSNHPTVATNNTAYVWWDRTN